METVLRAAAIYAVLLIVMRLSGRRTLAQMTPFDFVLILIVAETTQQALLGDDFSIVNAVVLIITLFTIHIALSYLKGRWPRSAVILDGANTVLISDGTLDSFAMKRSRIQLEDILRTARHQHGLENLEQIKSAVLEVSGGISIIPR